MLSGNTCWRSTHSDPGLEFDAIGGVGHAWYRSKFILPYRAGREAETRFIAARVDDNRFNNPACRHILEAVSMHPKTGTGLKRRDA
jgi:hypothetical protein